MGLRVVDCSREDFRAALAGRGSVAGDEVSRAVAEIIEQVGSRGDEALLAQARKFDCPTLERIAVTSEEIALAEVSGGEREAIESAYSRILDFHRRQLGALTLGWTQRGRGFEWQVAEDMRLGQRMSPLGRVGIYVPGGGAAYPSSVLMLTGPARAAGVGEIVCASPATSDGSLHPAVRAALGLAGVDQTFKIGGAGAIAAMALGTETVPRVDKIAGPGNRYVNEAKRQLWGSVGLDGFAGPSEVCVLADRTANARFAVADLLAQIEHAPDNAGFLVVIGEAKLGELMAELSVQVEDASRREIVERSLSEQSLGFLARDLDEAVEIVNLIAPEHLTLSVEDPESVLPRIDNAGCILMGDWTPESAADYALGPSHTLPTGSAARFGSPVNVLDFLKIQSIARLTKDQSVPICRIAEMFGVTEGLYGHAFDATVRLERPPMHHDSPT